MNAPMTEENAQAWSHLDPVYQIARLTDWAAMLEERMAKLDPNYMAYQWGLRPPPLWRYAIIPSDTCLTSATRRSHPLPNTSNVCKSR